MPWEKICMFCVVSSAGAAYLSTGVLTVVAAFAATSFQAIKAAITNR